MSNVYEICFTGQIGSISPNDVDFILQVEVTDVVNTKGTFSLQASDPSEFYGERYLEWELYSASFSEECYDVDEGNLSLCEWVVQGDSLGEISRKYFDEIEELLWESIDTTRDEEYIDADEPRYLEE